MFKVWQNWQKPQLLYHKPAFKLLIPVFLILAVGLFIHFILSPVLVGSNVEDISPKHFFWQHLFFILAGLGCLFLGFKINLKYWLRYAHWIVAVGLITSLLAVLLSGIGSDARWLRIGAFSIQSAEILKLGFLLLVSGYFFAAKNNKQNRLKDIVRANLLPLILFSVISFVILVLQRDYGSTFIIAMMFLGMLWVSGISKKVLTISILILALLGSLFIVSTPYRRDRINVFLDSSLDCQQGTSWHICQALNGVGSGGVAGRGFGESVQLYGYIPKPDNDSIFAILAETGGLIGSLSLISLFGYLIYSIYKIAIKLEDALMLIAVGIMIWIGLQAFINVAGILNLIPLKGITLPLVSSGGSSLAMVLMSLGIILQLSSYTRNRDARTTYKTNLSRRRDRRPRNTVARPRR